MKTRIITSTLLFILFAVAIGTDVTAAPWRGYRYRHGWCYEYPVKREYPSAVVHTKNGGYYSRSQFYNNRYYSDKYTGGKYYSNRYYRNRYFPGRHADGCKYEQKCDEKCGDYTPHRFRYYFRERGDYYYRGGGY